MGSVVFSYRCCAWLALVIVLCNLILPPNLCCVSAVASSRACVSEEDKQFVVVVSTPGSLGLRLSNKLVILEFVADAEGRSRVVEASALAEIGDRLISVNDRMVTSLSFHEAVNELQSADLPKELRFQTHDGRCLIPPSITIESSASDNQPIPARTYDYVVLSIGEKESEESIYAVLSGDGQPPSCVFREIVVASPIDACHPLTVNSTNKYLIVPSMEGCPAHQKAIYAQEAGAKGIVFIQHHGKKPQQIRIPTDFAFSIQLAMVMVSFDSGIRMLEWLISLHSSQTLQLRFVFSEVCATDAYATHPNEDPFQRSAVNRIESATAGFLSLTVAKSATTTIRAATLEFLKPFLIGSDGVVGDVVRSSTLPLGQYSLVFAPSQLHPCKLLPPSSQLALWRNEIVNSFVVVELRVKECSMTQHVEFFASMEASGVIFVDPEFPTAVRSAAVRQSAQQLSSMPFVFVSQTAMATMRAYGRDVQASHVLIEFIGENALEHQWKDLGTLSQANNWPTTARARQRLYYRMLKDQEMIGNGEVDPLFKHSERYQALQTSYEMAEQFYAKHPEK